MLKLYHTLTKTARGFPTPRSWEHVSEMVKILKQLTFRNFLHEDVPGTLVD